MGLLEILKKILSPASTQLSQSTAQSELSPDEYTRMRQAQVDWFEKHYDLNTVEGINAIPDKNPKRPPMGGVTGEVYYYLRSKSYQFEESGEIDLALACLRKSVAILKNNNCFNAAECYPLVRMLARHGYIDEAYQVKADIDSSTSKAADDFKRTAANRMRESPKSLKTDLVIMDVHGAVCSECAKYQGRVYSISGKSKLFPRVPDFYFRDGNVHDDCSHSFSPYIHGVSDPQLEYTLSVHPLQDKRYGRNIVVFSNRPFVDDRTEECRKEAENARSKLQAKLDHQNDLEDTIIEREYQKFLDNSTLSWLQEHFPDKCPKSLSGFRRMRTQNTKNYQLLKQLAAEMGREI